jgi:hypothetical protein
VSLEARRAEFDRIVEERPWLGSVPEVGALRKELEEKTRTSPEKAGHMLEALSYVAGIYEPARQVLTETRTPDAPRAIFIPVSEKFCPIDATVLRGKKQAAWKALRDELDRKYEFSSIAVVFYDGTMRNLMEKVASRPDISKENALVYIDAREALRATPEQYAALGGKATVVKEELVRKEELKPGEEEGAYISIGGHVILALGILDIVKNNRADSEYLAHVANLASAISRNMTRPEEFLEMLKKGELTIKLPPIQRIDINTNMETYFSTEEAVMKSL